MISTYEDLVDRSSQVSTLHRLEHALHRSTDSGVELLQGGDDIGQEAGRVVVAVI